MDPDEHKDDEDEEENLFERRDPNEIPSWNPTNVVDYGSKQKKAAEGNHYLFSCHRFKYFYVVFKQYTHMIFFTKFSL